MLHRTVWALAMLGLFLLPILVDPLRSLFPAVIIAFGALTLHELVEILRRKSLRVSFAFCLIALLALVTDGQMTGLRHGLHIVTITFLALMVDRVVRQDFQNIASEAGAAMLAIVYVGMASAMSVALMAQPIAGGRMMGPLHILFLAAVVFCGDSAAYIVGSRFGKRRFFPILSPKKSLEGAVASVVVSVLAGLVCLLVSPTLRQVYGFAHGLILALLLGLAAPIGDLAESAFKRDSGVKDSSNLIAGHGGFLDVFDALLFCMPLHFVYLQIFLA